MSENQTNAATRLASKSGISHPISSTNSKGSGSRKTSPSLAGAKNQNYKANFRLQDQPSHGNNMFNLQTNPTPNQGVAFAPEDTSYFGSPDQQRELHAYI